MLNNEIQYFQIVRLQIKSTMFLNQKHKRLTLDYKPKKQQSFLNSFGKYNKRSYSSSALKQEFQIFKNKSMSYSSLKNKNIDYQYQPLRQNFKGLYEQKPVAYQFKKSYLHSDSKLNKCALHKQGFKSFNKLNINQSKENFISKYPTLGQNNQESSRLSNNKGFMLSLQKMNTLLKQQNQQLKNQRMTDLELIAKQNKVIKNQQYIISQNMINMNSERGSFSIGSQFKKNSKSNTNQALQCQQCKFHKYKNIQGQYQQIRVQKLQQQRKQFRKQIHQLVFKCEEYKSQIKSLNQKYEKQIKHNQKLIRLLYPEQLKEKYSKPSSDHIYHKNSSMNNSHIVSQNEKQQNKQSFKNSFKESCNQSIIDIYKRTKIIEGDNYNKPHIKNKKQPEDNFEWCENANIRKYLQEINRQKKQEIDQIESLLKYS